MVEEIKQIFVWIEKSITLKNNKKSVKPELLLYQFRTEVCKQHLIKSREKQLLSFSLWAQ